MHRSSFFLPNSVGYINISELSIKPEDTKSPAVTFSVNPNLDLISALHFHYCYIGFYLAYHYHEFQIKLNMYMSYYFHMTLIKYMLF